MPKILIVDDEYSMRLAIEISLKALGYDLIYQAESGEQAVIMARDLKPDIILMDIKMPGRMDGISAAEKIRSEMDVGIVFLTGYATHEYIERAKRVEPFGYVMKPYLDEELQASIEIALYKNGAEKEIRKSRREWENIFQVVGHSTLLLDRDHRLIHANKATEKVTGMAENPQRHPDSALHGPQ